MIDKERIKINAKIEASYKRESASKHTARLLSYHSDPDRKVRKEKGECKHCHYLSSRIGGSAMTRANCKACDKEMLFDNTCTDNYCQECGKEYNVCRRCGGTMD